MLPDSIDKRNTTRHDGDMSIPTDLPPICHFQVVWHAGEPEQRKYWRKERTHVTSTSRYESGVTMISCERCGHLAGDV